jgi:hypothetical protein
VVSLLHVLHVRMTENRSTGVHHTADLSPLLPLFSRNAIRAFVALHSNRPSCTYDATEHSYALALDSSLRQLLLLGRRNAYLLHHWRHFCLECLVRLLDPWRQWLPRRLSDHEAPRCISVAHVNLAFEVMANYIHK